MGGGEWTPTCLYGGLDRQGFSTKVRLFLHINKFIFVEHFPYLCLMKTYLKTPTSDMTTAQIRRVVGETIAWCQDNLGTKSYKVDYSVRTLREGYTPAYGMYDPTIRTILVFRNYSPTVKDVIRAVIHEYTHYLQNLRWYNNVLSKVGYDKHPQEIEARVTETMYSICWNDIKNKL